jgi:hypothetical protein
MLKRTAPSRTHMLQAALHPQARQWFLTTGELLCGSQFSNAHLQRTEHSDHVTLAHPSQYDHAFPVALVAGDTVRIHPVGVVLTSYAAAIVVALTSVSGAPSMALALQADGRRLLHVTIGCADGVRPVAANDAIATQVVRPLRASDRLVIPDLLATVRRLRV